jgi:hypothetical protein
MEIHNSEDLHVVEIHIEHLQHCAAQLYAQAFDTRDRYTDFPEIRDHLRRSLQRRAAGLSLTVRMILGIE